MSRVWLKISFASGIETHADFFCVDRTWYVDILGIIMARKKQRLSGHLWSASELPSHKKLVGYSQRQIDYAMRVHGIEPARRIGIVRFFEATQVNKIVKAVKETARTRADGVVGVATRRG